MQTVTWAVYIVAIEPVTAPSDVRSSQAPFVRTLRWTLSWTRALRILCALEQRSRHQRLKQWEGLFHVSLVKHRKIMAGAGSKHEFIWLVVSNMVYFP